MGSFKATKNTEAHLDKIRLQRNRILLLTDYAVAADSPLDPGSISAVQNYRTLLRDCTNPPPGTMATLPDYTNAGLPAGIVRAIRLELAALV